MKRLFAAAIFIVLCLTCSSSAFAHGYNVKKFPNKETTANLSGVKHVCTGWVDMDPNRWVALDYDTKKEWSDIVDSENVNFPAILSTYIPAYKVTAAKDVNDTSMDGCDLYVKFTDVKVDYDHYHLVLGIHFIDPKTGTEIGVVPTRPYFGDAFHMDGFLNAALKEISKKIDVEITGVPYKGK